MSSGVAVDDNCATLFQEMKLKHTKRYLVFKIEDKKKIFLDTEGDSEKTYDDFLEAIKSSAEPRYGLVDVKFEKADGTPQEKIVFINYSPDDCGVKMKMLYASSKDSIKKKFTGGVAKELQCNDVDELAYDEIVKAL